VGRERVRWVIAEKDSRAKAARAAIVRTAWDVCHLSLTSAQSDGGDVTVQSFWSALIGRFTAIVRIRIRRSRARAARGT
jgi:hypothetical protein